MTDTVHVGQRVLTSGYSRHYPRGLAVGRVVRAVPDASRLMLEVEVEPAVHLSRLRHAFVIPGSRRAGSPTRSLGGLILLLMVTLLLRSTALSSLAARGIVLDVLAFATVVWALRNGETSGATFGFLLGLAAEPDAAHWLGRHTLALALIGYGVGRLNQTLMRDRAATHLILIVAATVLHQAGHSVRARRALGLALPARARRARGRMHRPARNRIARAGAARDGRPGQAAAGPGDVRSHNVEGSYEGPQLRDVLASVDVPHGDALRGPSLRLIVAIDAADGYRAVFSLAEFDPAFRDRQVILATDETASRWMLPKARSGWWSPTKHVPPAGSARSLGSRSWTSDPSSQGE